MGLSSRSSLASTNKRPAINKAPPPKVEQAKPAEVIPKWPEADRGGPSSIFRSALFGIFHDRDRAALDRELIFSQGDTSILYWGRELNQLDLDVMLAVLHLSRGKKPGEQVHTSQADLLRLCGLKNAGENIRLLDERITRLLTAVVDIKTKQISHPGKFKRLGGALISSRGWDEVTGHMVFRLDEGIANLFPNASFTSFSYKVRSALGKNMLAQWLMAYYASHINPVPVYVETIHSLCGAAGDMKDAKFQKEFRRRLKVALQAIKDVSAAEGENFDFDIRKEKAGRWMVHVVTPLSDSKARYALKRGMTIRKRLQKPTTGLQMEIKKLLDDGMDSGEEF